MPEDKAIPVRVALRCRPLLPKETMEGCQTCLQFVPGEPQVLVLGTDKAFTYDYCYSMDTMQEQVFEEAVLPLLDGFFKGYNATVLAYGQTGSGKTHTMGGAYSSSIEDESVVGIIPRVIQHIFKGIQERDKSDFIIKVSYLELYNEEIIDLLSKEKENIVIRDTTSGGISITGLQEITTQTGKELVGCLEQGNVHRTTAATAMNATSSRSHAIFTISMEQRKKDDNADYCLSKFHLVDLAGSERAKKTKAEGDRFKEGVSINKGLLSLGNVISALGDESRGQKHVPYRDSKLTRLLQDSLGGNSHTVMIACVSPADSNLEETINTLRYADRARKIKNKPIVNRDPQTAELLRLKQMVQQLQIQLMQAQGGVISTGTAGINTGDVQKYVAKAKTLEEENRKLTSELHSAVEQSTQMCEKAIMAEMVCDKLKTKVLELKEHDGCTADLGQLMSDVDREEVKTTIDCVTELQIRIKELETELASPGFLYTDGEADSGENGETSSMDSDEFSTEHALRQAQMNKQLAELNKALQMKQELASKMSQNDNCMEEVRSEYEANVKKLEDEVSILLKEKEELCSMLQAAKSNNSLKVSEQRRKRVKELETQIGVLKRKITDHNKMVKLKEQSDKTCSKLNKEIQSIKQQRVKLMKQLKEEAEKFRRWRQEKEKEVIQLKQKDRKRQFKLVKLERDYEKSQAVLRRKTEEAAAAQRRLKDALSKQKEAAQKRQQTADKTDYKGLGTRVRSWLGEELEFLVSVGEARRHLDSLLMDRRAYSLQLQQLRQKLEESQPPRKRSRSGSESEGEGGQAWREQIHQQVEQLEQDIQCRNAQIADLQQKLVDADVEEKAKCRWENMRSLVEAKCGLKWLLDKLVESQINASTADGKVQELHTNLNETVLEMRRYRSEVDDLRNQHEEEKTTLQRQHEDKILYLLRQMPSSRSGSTAGTAEGTSQRETELLDKLEFQEKQIADLSHMHEQLEDMRKENESLRKQVTLASYKGKKLSLMPEINMSAVPEATKKAKPKAKNTKRRTMTLEAAPVQHYSLEEILSSEESDVDFSDDVEADPDWRATPLAKQLAKRRRQRVRDGGAAKPKPRLQTFSIGTSDSDSLPASDKRESSEYEDCFSEGIKTLQRKESKSKVGDENKELKPPRKPRAKKSSTSNAKKRSSDSLAPDDSSENPLFAKKDNTELGKGGEKKKRKLLRTTSENGFFGPLV
ncbi:PREDICTED: chromosome-associated kinesin KIF4A-like [Branchiostoma belcheri]|uniref:Chromosome-associated kinesin KIF4A-like n=1 Tax=Branchiostoma belcheri TaxID=7741 RepID=A0A6P4YJH8_BRABE|nr:PREDICTED: chromosome-associated kinesin KIF4A-like [Branchiostoma belcheri]